MEPTTTPSSPLSAARLRRSRGGSHRGFTLVELLVVIGIILLLMGILLPMVNKAMQHAKRASMLSDLQGISQALDAYKEDFGDYPRTTSSKPNGPSGTSPSSFGPSTGAVALCWALIAPGPATQDGAGVPNGPSGTEPGAPGFRLRGTQGKVYGPYLNVDRYRFGTLFTTSSGLIAVNLGPLGSSMQPATQYDDSQSVIADSQGNVILYFPGNKEVSPSATGLLAMQPIGWSPSPGGTPNVTAVYNYNDNAPYPLPGTTIVNQASLTPKLMAYKLGNTSAGSSMPYKTAPGEVPVIAPYLLWSAGPDGVLGPKTTNATGSLMTTGEDDDVTFPELSPVPGGIAP